MREIRNKQANRGGYTDRKEAIRRAFGSYAAMRDYVVDVAQMMLEGKADEDAKAKKEKRA